MTRARTGAAAAMAASVLLAGCGTTVRGTTQGLPGQAAGGRPATGPMVAAQQREQGLGPAAPSTALATADRPSAALGSRDVAQAPAATPPAGRALAVGARTVRVGFLIPIAHVPTATGIRVEKENFADIVDALAADLNRHGGLGGRQIERPAPMETLDDTNTVEAKIAQEQQACIRFTEDDRVFAVIAIAAPRYSKDCYVQHHTPVFTRTMTISADEQSMRESAPWLLPDDTPDLDTMARVLAAALHREGFVDKHMGIIAPDEPEARRTVTRVLLPALRAYGGVAAEHDVIYGKDDIEDAPAESASTVQIWKTDKVTTAVLFDLGIAWGGLAAAAKSQAYYPRWGMDSFDEPARALEQQPAPQDGELDAVAAGYFPLFDVNDDVYPLAPAEHRCLDTVNRALGTSYGHRNMGDGGAALIACRSMWFVQQVMADDDGRPLVGSQLAAQVAALGSRYKPLDWPGSEFRPGKYDGIAGYRTVRFFSDCTCMRYDSAWLTPAA